MDAQAWMTRVDKKLDEIGDAIVSLARAEERIVTIFQRMETIEKRQADASDRLFELEKTSEKRSVFFSTTERLFWAIITAGVGLAAYYLR